MKSSCVALFVGLFLVINLIFLYSFLSCYHTVLHSPESIWEDDAKVTAYLNALPLQLPDTCVLHIRREIPEKLHDLFCQRLYSQLPYELPVQLKFAHLAAYEKYLPPTASQRRSIQLFRGSLYTENLKFDSARFCLQDAYVIAHENGMGDEDTGDILRKLANTYLYEENYTKAVQLLLEVHRSEVAQQEARLAEAEKQQKMAHFETLLVILLLLLALVVVFWRFVRQTMHHQSLLQTATLLKQERELAETLKIHALERSQANLQLTHRQLVQSNQLVLLKNRLIAELKMRLSEHGELPSETIDDGQMKILTETDWRKFRDHFEERFPHYIQQLHMEFPALTGAEIRLFLLIKLGFGNNEIAGTLGISPESVYKSRFRLRKKLGCSKELGLDEFIQVYAAAAKPDVKS